MEGIPLEEFSLLSIVEVDQGITLLVGSTFSYSQVSLISGEGQGRQLSGTVTKYLLLTCFGILEDHFVVEGVGTPTIGLEPDQVVMDTPVTIVAIDYGSVYWLLISAIS